ncbi:MAG: hypothetical protein ACLFVW_06120 [Phycisphaerae bacterium]
MERKRVLLAILTTATAGVLSCGQPPPAPPSSPAEHAQMGVAGRLSYPKRMVVLHNVQRVLDDELPDEKRIDSLRLLDKLDVKDRDVNEHLAALLADNHTPESVRRAVLEYLLERDYPGLARFVVGAFSNPDSESRLREPILDWLTRHPTPEVLSEVVKIWAREPADGEGERRFRQVVERITGKNWRDALLGALGARDFSARGSAFEVMRARMDKQALSRLILSLQPNSDAVRALQIFLRRFEYLPEDRESLLTVATHAARRTDRIEAAARLCRQWRREHDYRFRLRDFHLLSELSRDPLRGDLPRTQLVLEVGRGINSREHISYTGRRSDPDDEYADNFWVQADSISVADLWRLHLLNEMFYRPRIRLALRRMARLDRTDQLRAWGGLVFYENGQAEAKLYPGKESPATPWRFVPSEEMLTDARDSLCRFHAHFDQVENRARVGPDSEELRQARKDKYDALVLTSLDKERFCAHYYTAEGRVVSLGTFRYGS